MSEPPESSPGSHRGEPPDEQPQPDFDPYRYGAPEHPVPPEYAPPGYRPPPPYPPPPGQQGQPGYPGYPGYPNQPYQQRPPEYPGYPDQPNHPYSQQPPPPPYGMQYPPPRAGHGKAVASLVLGICSIVFCWLSIIDAIPVILALIFGGIGLSEARRKPNGEGRRLAIAGIACAVVGAVLAIALSVWLYSRVSTCLNYDTGSNAYTQCVRDRI